MALRALDGHGDPGKFGRMFPQLNPLIDSDDALIELAEAMLGLVHGDHKSFLWLRSNWKPELPRADADNFTMVDMLNFVNDMNPTA